MAADPDAAHQAAVLNQITEALLQIVQIGLADGAADMRQVAGWALADVVKLNGLDRCCCAALPPSRLH